MRFVPGEDRLVVGSSGHLRLLDWRAGRFSELPGEKAAHTDELAVPATGRYVVSDCGFTLQAWDLKTQQPAGQVEREDYFRGLQPGGKKGGIYALNSRRAELVHWDVAAGRSEKVLDVARSPDVPRVPLGGTGCGLAVYEDRVAIVAIRPGFAVVDIAAKAVTKFVTLPGEGDIIQLAFSADGSRLVVNHLEDLIVFDTAKWTPVAKFRVADPAALSSEMAFTPDGKTVVMSTALDSLVKEHPSGVTLFDAETCRDLGYFQTHPDYSPHISVSSDGKHLATAGPDGVKIWDLAAIIADFRKAAP